MRARSSSSLRALGYLSLCALLMILSCHRTSVPRKTVSVENFPSDIAVRFFFEPFLINHIHLPLIVRALDPNNREFDAVALAMAGRTVYISRPEMERLLGTLDQLTPSWTRTNRPTLFKSVTELPTIYGMEITETHAQGSANASIRPQDVCALLEKLNPLITAPRARWEFQRFRAESDCKVPDFNPKLYPLHP